MDPIGGYDIDGFGNQYKTPEGRLAQILSKYDARGGLDGPYIDSSLMSREEIADALEGHIQQNSSAWANHGERSAAMKAYALQDPSDDKYEVMGKWNEATDLLDPRTQQLKENITDLAFLRNYTDSDEQIPSPANGLDALSYGLQDSGLHHQKQKTASLVDDYDREMQSPLAHSQDRGLLSHLTDPGKNVGWYMNRANIGPAALKMRFGGENPSALDSAYKAIGNMQAQETYRLNTNSPVADLPDNSSPADIRARLKELGERQALAQEPGARERWLRTTGIDPHPAVQFMSDLFWDLFDPSLAAEVATGVPGVVATGKGMAKRSLLSNLRGAGIEGAKQFGPDAAVESGFQAYAGFDSPTYGNGSPVKSPEEIEYANQIRANNETVRLPQVHEDAYNEVRKAADARRNVRDAMGGIRN